MKRNLFLFIFFFVSTSIAVEYRQLVKPVRASEILSYMQFQLKKSLSDFFKKSTAPVQLSLTQIFMLQPPMRCVNPQLTPDSSELFVTRVLKSTPAGQLIRESLILKACNRRLEIFTLEREGLTIAPTSDDDLLRGKIPDIKGTSLYRLYLRDRKVKMEVIQEPQELKMEVVIGLSDNISEFRLNLQESLPAQDLTRQHFNLIYIRGTIILESYDMEYIWNFDSQTSVPREYFYYQQKEILSGDFVKTKDSIYNQAIYPLILVTMQFFSSPL